MDEDKRQAEEPRPAAPRTEAPVEEEVLEDLEPSGGSADEVVGGIYPGWSPGSGPIDPSP